MKPLSFFSARGYSKEIWWGVLLFLLLFCLGIGRAHKMGAKVDRVSGAVWIPGSWDMLILLTLHGLGRLYLIYTGYGWQPYTHFVFCALEQIAWGAFLGGKLFYYLYLYRYGTHTTPKVCPVMPPKVSL